MTPLFVSTDILRKHLGEGWEVEECSLKIDHVIKVRYCPDWRNPDGPLAKEVVNEGGYVQQFIGCCGVGLISLCRTPEVLVAVHNSVKNVWSSLMYVATERQEDLVVALEQLGYKRINVVSNKNSGKLLYTYCWNRPEE